MKVDLYKKVFDKEQVNKVIDTNFNELLTPKDPTFFDVNLATIDDFFTLYNKFFFDIPKEGENSHLTLVQRSGDYIDFERTNETIEALVQEVTSLREENIKFINKKNQDEVGNIVDNINAVTRNLT